MTLEATQLDARTCSRCGRIVQPRGKQPPRYCPVCGGLLGRVESVSTRGDGEARGPAQVTLAMELGRIVGGTLAARGRWRAANAVAFGLAAFVTSLFTVLAVMPAVLAIGLGLSARLLADEGQGMNHRTRTLANVGLGLGIAACLVRMIPFVL